MTWMIELEHVTKLYGTVLGVNDMTLQLAPGAWGLLGPNGAGKSTLLNLLIGQLRPTRGTVRVLGQTPRNNAALMRRIGFCPAFEGMYAGVSGLEWTTWLLQLQGVRRNAARERAAQCLERVGMADSMQRPIASYSRGMRQPHKTRSGHRSRPRTPHPRRTPQRTRSRRPRPNDGSPERLDRSRPRRPHRQPRTPRNRSPHSVLPARLRRTTPRFRNRHRSPRTALPGSHGNSDPLLCRPATLRSRTRTGRQPTPYESSPLPPEKISSASPPAMPPDSPDNSLNGSAKNTSSSTNSAPQMTPCSRCLIH
ncbi:MAG UNVERIFIED_CONTAM: ATP-binding cassette domain-containing protein [Planctomycetaceae bacterium]